MGKNQQLPGNLRYQPKSLTAIFGYDNLYRQAIEVEFATMHALHEAGKLPASIYALLTPDLEEQIKNEITTTMVDKLEREVTHHDVRALVRLIQERLPAELRRYVHIPLTSYDVLDTARILQFKAAYEHSLKPSLLKAMSNLVFITNQNSDLLQIGRTHGQHALPITVGFWLATILDRLFNNWKRLELANKNLKGKISGAVGAHNAQEIFGLDNFEYLVLRRLKLERTTISTQIMPPEPLAEFLYACLLLSATLAQFGRDCRHLMRSEIGEVAESFELGQVGSSTMAHKRNPINFENLEGMFMRNRAEFMKVTDLLISEHQRDLTGSSLMRDLPIIVINLQQQLDTINREKDGQPFLKRLIFDEVNLQRNFHLNADVFMAEPIYIALQLFGYEGDAHNLINSELLPAAKKSGITLIEQMQITAINDKSLKEILGKIPSNIIVALESPDAYIGDTSTQSRQIAYKVWQNIECFLKK